MNPWDILNKLPVDLPSLIGWIIIIGFCLVCLFGLLKIVYKLFGLKGVNKLYLGNIKPSDYIAKVPKNFYLPNMNKETHVPKFNPWMGRFSSNTSSITEVNKKLGKINSKEYWNYINKIGGNNVIKRQDDKEG